MMTTMNYFASKKFVSFILLYVCLVKTHMALSHLEKLKDFEATTLLIHGESIYIGGVNKILRLDTNLNIVQEKKNGQVLNNMFCLPTSLSKCLLSNTEKTSNTLRLEDNINKILLYSEKPIPMIIACGSVYQGICQFLDVNTLQNISEIYTNTMFSGKIFSAEAYVSSNGPDASATAFITYKQSGGAYLVNAKTITTKLINSGFAISNIQLGNTLSERTFLASEEKILYPNAYFSNQTATYQVDYKSSFKIENHVYFTTYQDNYDSKKSQYLSKIIQVALEDGVFEYYIEFPLVCQKGGIDYNRIISSTLLKVNTSKEILPDVKFGDNVLFGIFGSDSSPGKYGLCSFLFNDLKKEVTITKQNCQDIKTVPWSQNKKSDCKVSFFS